MLLCLDVGNTQIHGAVFEGDALRLQFRKSTHPLGSSDELGIFFLSALREGGIPPAAVGRIAICCVVPAALYSLRGAAEKYFHARPFILQAGVKTGLKVRYRNPAEVGADRVAAAIAAAERAPGRDLIVVDCGTATTFDVVTSTGDYLGGAIMPGVGVAAESLASHTAKLPRVEIVRPEVALGRSTVESIQSGLHYGTVGAIRHLLERLTDEVFATQRPHVIGTGGFARLFEEDRLFDEIVPELVLAGLRRAARLNDAGE
ncbi:MAG TPA: type III pantothenate kinase [Opitutaceae bacterium]|jgi:type III pantothenate kinase|nr:type III pantothenate kinase [Opitutaceae bacterium]